MSLMRKISAQEREEFAIDREKLKEAGPLADTLTPEILADLWDVISKFGSLNHEGIKFLSLEQPFELTVNIGDKNGRMILIAGDSGQTSEGAYTVFFKSDYAIWDTRVSIAQITQFIMAADATALSRGGISLATGERIDLHRVETKRSKMSVEKTFALPGAVMPILNGKSAKDILAEFDHPEELMVIEDPFGLTNSIGRVRDKDLFEQRQAIVQEILGEMGIRTLDQLSELSLNQIIPLRALIDERMKAKAAN